MKLKHLISSLTKSTCQNDSIRTKLQTHCIDNIAPIITHNINLPLTSDIFPHDFITAFKKPLLKTNTLDCNDLKVTI